MTIDDLKEFLLEYNGDAQVRFYDVERGYLEPLSIDINQLNDKNNEHIAFILTQQESE